MRLASFLLSLLLHLGFIALAWLWPSSPPIKLDGPPVLISLVDGAPGGNRMPSPVLGPQGAVGEKLAPPLPAPPDKEASTAPPPEVSAPEAPKEIKMEPKPEPKPEPSKPKQPEPQAPDAIPIAEKKKPEPPKPEPPKPEPPKEQPKKPEPAKVEQPKEQPKKPEPPKAETAKKPEPPKAAAAPKSDPVKDALNKARASASSTQSTPQTGSAVQRALAEAKRKAGGHGGGGGGEGDGPGGGGLVDVYIGMVMMAVRANWSYATASRANMVCSVRVKVDAAGKVLNASLERSSGNSLFDASAVNAVIKTGAEGQFPPPPGAQYNDLLLSFSLAEMQGR